MNLFDLRSCRNDRTCEVRVQNETELNDFLSDDTCVSQSTHGHMVE